MASTPREKYVSTLCSPGTKSLYKDESQKSREVKYPRFCNKVCPIVVRCITSKWEGCLVRTLLWQKWGKAINILSYWTKTEKFFRLVKSWITGRSLELKGSIMSDTRMNLGRRSLEELRELYRMLKRCIHPRDHEHQYSVDSNLHARRGHQGKGHYQVDLEPSGAVNGNALGFNSGT